MQLLEKVKEIERQEMFRSKRRILIFSEWILYQAKEPLVLIRKTTRRDLASIFFYSRSYNY